MIYLDTIVFDEDRNEYKVIEIIGNGSFGYVYKIEKLTDNSVWALKTLPLGYIDRSQIDGLINEGKHSLKISHQNVVKYSYFHDGNTYQGLPPYIIMEYANQGVLKNIIDGQMQKEFIPINELVNYFNQLIDGMEAINAVLIHRDIKPDNILIHNELLKISDFGLSKIVGEQTRTHSFKGCGHFKYSSPESWNFEKNTIQMDIYSMGIVFYELATLQHPYKVERADETSWREAHLYQSPVPPDKINTKIPPLLSQLILKMLEKKPGDRYSNWEEIRRKLHNIHSLDASENNVLLKELLMRRLEQDKYIEETELKNKKRDQEIEQQIRAIEYQIDKDIISPLTNFLNQFNENYEKKNKNEVIKHTPLIYSIRLVSGAILELEIQSLLSENFYREERINDFGREIIKRGIKHPEFKKQKIMAWGYFVSSEGKGFNLLLVENPDSQPYGDWYILINRNSAFSSRQRTPEPFPFNFDEIEQELPKIGIVHIYRTEVIELILTPFIELIREYII